MEIIIKKEQKERTEKFIEFAESLTDKEARDFEIFIKGYRLAKEAQEKKSA